MNKKPKLTSRLAQWAGFPFVLMLLAAVASWLIAVNFLGGSPLISALFAISTVALMVVCVIGAIKLRYNSGDLGTFMGTSHAATLEERRREAREALDKMRDDLLFVQARKNQVDFYSKVLIVVGYVIVYMAAMFMVFGVYPAQAFMLPWWALAGLWIVLLRFMPRTVVVLFLLAASGVSAIVAVLGPTVILQFLPYFLTMPLFMFMNFFILFGPLMFFNIQQMQIVRPGEGEWMITFDEVRGQDEAKAQILSDLSTFLYSGEDEPLTREKGILMVGPPGVGKTLTAKAIATHLNAPVVLTTGSAFISTFVGVGIFVMLYLKYRVESLAAEYGRALVYIDEAEQLLMRRFGVMDGNSGNSQSSVSIYDLMDHDANGETGDLVFDAAESHAITWAKKYPDRHQVITGAGMGMGGMGAQMTLPVYLNWLDGVPTPPMVERLWRSTVNWALDILFIPPLVKFGKRKITLRVPRAKPVERLVLHLAATNVPQVIDPAMTRPGRFGRIVQFTLPGEEERADIADLYFAKAGEKGLLSPELRSREKIFEFAQAAVGLSPAQEMQAIYGAPAIRKAHVSRLKELAKRIERGDELNDRDQRFWKRFEKERSLPDWDRTWATWDSLMESLRGIRYGLAKPTRTSPRHRETTAYHESIGHLLPLRAFAGEFIKPTILSIMPRGQALGMVAHVPVEEHDPQPQRFWEGLLRVMVGSIVAERLFFRDSQPGVISDLQTATRVASAMVGNYGMVPRKSSEAEREKYIEIGRTILFSPSGEPMGMLGMADPSQGILGSKRIEVALMLGQAFTDVYRLIKKNETLGPAMAAKLLEEDEIMGQELTLLWEDLGTKIKPLDATDLNVWPDELIAPANPFYKEV